MRNLVREERKTLIVEADEEALRSIIASEWMAMDEASRLSYLKNDSDYGFELVVEVRTRFTSQVSVQCNEYPLELCL